MNKVYNDSYQQLVKSLKKAPLSQDEIEGLWKVLKMKFRRNERVIAKKFVVGDCVAFDTGKGSIVGTITKVNPASLIVDCEGKKWRVAPSLVKLHDISC